MDIDFLLADRVAVTHRNLQGLPPLPLTADQVLALIQLCQKPPIDSIHELKNLLINRIEPGMNDAAHIKASFLYEVAKGNLQTPALNPQQAIQVLGTMWGGPNVVVLTELLDYPDPVAEEASHQLALNVFLFDTYYDVVDKHQRGNPWASAVLQKWAEAQWLKQKAELPDYIQGTVFKVSGLINAEMFSPRHAAWTRSDIPLHAQSFLQTKFPNAIQVIEKLKEKGEPIIFVSDQIELSHTSNAHYQAALNTFSWLFGEKIPFFPNRAYRGIMIAQTIDTQCHKWAQYNGALCIEADTHSWQTGDVIKIYRDKNSIVSAKGATTNALMKQNQLESWQVGGYLTLQLGRVLTQKAHHLFHIENKILSSTLVSNPNKQHYSLAQKMVGRACGLDGIKPMHHCEPYLSIVAAPQMNALGYSKAFQLPSMGVSSELVIEPFQHPNVGQQQRSLASKGCVMLKPGDGMIHAWLNRLLLPGEVGVGSHAYTAFPVGFGFSIEQALIPLATSIGKLPFVMPESVLVIFSGQVQSGITIRDLVYAIPYVAEQKGFLIPNSSCNILANRVIEIMGLSELTVEQAFEFSEASTDWGAKACVLHFSHEVLKKHVQSGIQLLHWMMQQQYHDIRTLNRRVLAMQAWLQRNEMLDSDPDAEYAAIIEIDLKQITEPLVASLQMPQHVQPLSAIANTAIDEAFVGGLEMFVGSYRAVGEIIRNIEHPLKIPLWITPASQLEALQLMQEGYYALYADKGVHTGMPDHNLCMSTQLTHAGTIVTSAKRAFLKNKIQPVQGYLCSPELASVTAALGYFPSIDEYQMHLSILEAIRSKIDRPMDFYFGAYNDRGLDI